MDNIINLLTSDLMLAPEYLFVARCVTLLLVVDVMCSLIQLGVGFAKTIGR